MTNPVTPPNADTNAQPNTPAKPRRSAPIVPGSSVAGRTLMFLVAIMTFLSCVTLGAVVLVQKSAIGWSSEIGRELTVQIRPIDGETMDSNLRTIVGIAEATPGVARAYALDQDESKALLEPWLGAGIDLDSLVLPRLVIIELADPANADIATIERGVASIPGATLETHDAWRQQLNVMAGTMVVSGLLVLGLIVVATMLAVVFATRGTMASNREIVDVLHFIGASNNFIAGEFQGRFLRIGLTGGAIGGIAALVFFVITGIAVATILPSQSSAQLSVLFGGFWLGWEGLSGIILTVPIIAGLTAFTSRMTVRRFLAQTS